MKKILLPLVVSIALLGSTYGFNTSIGDATTWLYNNGLTKYSDATSFRPNDTLTREQAAKFFSQYAITTLKKTVDTSASCTFTDIDTADVTLKQDIINSCQLGIFKGTKGYFYPKKTLTYAEMSAVLIRVRFGFLQEQEGQMWYDDYIAMMKKLGLTVKNPDVAVSRGDTAISLYDIVNSASIKGYKVKGYTQIVKRTNCPIGSAGCANGNQNMGSLYFVSVTPGIVLPFGYNTKAPIGLIDGNGINLVNGILPTATDSEIMSATKDNPVSVELFYDIHDSSNKDPLLYISLNK